MKAVVTTVVGLLVCTAEFVASFEGIDERIYNGIPASKGQFPFISMLVNHLNTGNSTGCTGSLISDQWLLLAAHCCRDANSARAFLGISRDTINNETDHVLIYDIPKSNIFKYPLDNPEKKTNDLCLYKLPTSVPLDQFPNIKTIALPKLSDRNVDKFNDQNATAAGWGAYNDTTPTTSSLRYAPVHIQNHDQCVAQLRPLVGRNHPITRKMICIDKTIFHHGACPGDSGGPLILNGTDGNPMVIGASSYMVGPCSNKNPTVYTFIPPYLRWISATTGIAIS